MMQEQQPRLKFVFHDAFHAFDAGMWNDLFDDDDHENVVMDTHQYFAWGGPHGDIGTYCDEYGANLANAGNIKYDIWVGEWSLATDVCALWLGGFNDSNTAPAESCQWVDCPTTYLTTHGTDFDRTAATLGPYGSSGLGNEQSVIKNGKCPIDSSFYADDQVMRLGQCVMDIFNNNVEGHFMWTVRNEIEPRWEYVASYDAGWINQNVTEAEIVQE